MEFKRSIYEILKQDSESAKISIIFGARQVGKTYILKKLARNTKNTKYFNLEIADDLRQFNASDAEILDFLQNSATTIFIDEFHYVENISHIFKAIYDIADLDPKKKIKIYASGSSAMAMHKHLKESLAGRLKKYKIRPLSYEEFQTHKDIDSSLETFLNLGALPGVYDNHEHPTVKEKQDYLNSIFNTYIQKDIKSLVEEENISAFNNLLYILAEKQGQVISTSSLASAIRVSNKTVERYINILEETFVIYTLHSFAGNLSNELKKSKKYYFYDLGIRNALLKDFRSLAKRKDKGSIWEAFTYHYLLSIAHEATTDIRFWRTSEEDMEIDFIWINNRISAPIEVKSKLNRANMLKPLDKFLRAYPQSPCAIVLNENIDEEIYHKNKTIHYVSFENISCLEAILKSYDLLL